MGEPQPKRDLGTPAPPIIEPSMGGAFKLVANEPEKNGLNPWVIGIPAIVLGLILGGDMFAKIAMSRRRPAVMTNEPILSPSKVASQEITMIAAQVVKDRNISDLHPTQAISKDYKNMMSKLLVTRKAVEMAIASMKGSDLDSPAVSTKEGRVRVRRLFATLDKAILMNIDVRSFEYNSFLNTWRKQYHLLGRTDGERLALGKKERKLYKVTIAKRNKAFAFLDKHQPGVAGNQITFDPKAGKSYISLLNSYQKAANDFVHVDGQYEKVVAKQQVELVEHL